MSITSKEITQEAVAFICEWYRCIDQKEDFSVIGKQILGREITVDFPNNPMGYEGFQNGMKANAANIQESTIFIR